MEEILAQFQAGKDANFSLLSYVSDVHAEVEKLEAQIATLTAEVRKYKGSGTSAADTRRAGLQVGTHTRCNADHIGQHDKLPQSSS